MECFLLFHIHNNLRDFVTDRYNKNICTQIIKYLSGRNEKQGDLNDLLLAVYGQEIDKLTKEILRNVGYLISQGIIKEEKVSNGEIFYRVVDEDRTLE